jgi:hypothetical protein
MKSKAKKITVFIVIFTFLLSSVGFASDYYKQINAWFGDIKIVNNNQTVYPDTQPFIAEGTTYVSVRTMANLFNKEIGWNGDTRTITVTDKPDSEVLTLKQQLASKDFEISQLKAKVSALELHLGDDSSTTDLDDLEDQLNDDYDEYRDIEFDITLSGDEDDITVKIDVDRDDFEDEWDDLTDSRKKTYLQDIVDDILDEYEDADIDGYIRDSSSSKTSKLLTFDVSSSGNVRMYDDDDSTSISDLEDDLNDEYEDYFDDIELSIDLNGDSDNITYRVYIDYDEYEDEWDDLTDNKIRSFMSAIYGDIEYELDDPNIMGYVFDKNDNSSMARYTRLSDNTVSFSRYEP